MTYEEALGELGRMEEADEAAREERRKGRSEPLPFDLATATKEEFEERLRQIDRALSENPILFHRIRKGSRGRRVLSHDHPDGRPRWVEGFPLEGGPEHPSWQKTLAKAPVLSEKERAEDDWRVESYAPTGF
ncbi:hypothetical protein EON79_05125 [bacterium]|nr:MAG: hypothetical protein EON79_05125 [bacterium]